MGDALVERRGAFSTGSLPANTKCHSTMSLTPFSGASRANLLRKTAIFEELAGRQGFEPRYHGPEPRVLPLDDLPVPVAMLCAVRTVDYSIAPDTGASRVAASLNGSLSTRSNL